MNRPLELVDLDRLFFKPKKYLDIDKFINPITTLHFLVSFKKSGKSYSALKYVVKRMIEKDEEFGWIRNTEKEFIKSNVRASFVKMIDDFGFSKQYKVTSDGVYKVLGDGAFKLMGMFAFMNTAMNTSSQNALNNVKTIVYDEFINPDFHLPDLHSRFMKMVDTIKRNNVVNVFCLGNKHESDNDLLSESGLELEWEKKDHQVIHKEEAGISFYYLDFYEIKGQDASTKQTQKWSMYSQDSQKFFSGGLHRNSMGAVKSWNVNNLEKVFTPIFRFDWNDQRYCFGEINDEGNIVSYIKLQFDWQEFNNVKCYCFRARDISRNSDNVLVRDVNDNNVISILLNRWKNGNLWFSHAFAAREFRYILDFVKMLSL